MMKIGKKDSFVFVEKEVIDCVLTQNIKKLVKFITKLDEKKLIFDFLGKYINKLMDTFR